MSTIAVFCAGASASGKTSFSRKLKADLESKGISTYLISMDNYYKPRNGAVELSNFDLPEVFDLDLLRQHVQAINAQKAVELPQFSFAVKDRLKETIPFDPKDTQVVIIEGIHALYDINSYKLDDEQKYSIFVETESYLSYLTRRIIRDIPPANEGGRNTPEEVTRERELKCGVRDAFFEHIATVKRYADYVISNDGPNDLDDALKPVVDEILARVKTESKDLVDAQTDESLPKVKTAVAKTGYSIDELIEFFGGRKKSQKNPVVETVVADELVTSTINCNS